MSARPLHIVHIIQSLGVGGAEHCVVNIINESDPSQFRFSVILVNDHQPLSKAIKRSGVVVRHVPKHTKSGRQFTADLVSVLTELQADVVHTHLFTADIWGTLAARRLGLPTISTEHNVNREYGVLRTIIKWWFRNTSTRYVACSEAVRRYMQTHYRITKPIDVIPNGIFVKRFSGLPPFRGREPWRLAIIGRLSEQKGHAVAFRALAQLPHASWQLAVVGEGSLKPSLIQLATSLGIAERVHFLPFTSDIPGVLADTDIVLMPSLWEGLGVAAREAMAAGRLVIASSVDGLLESIAVGKTGWLTPPGNVSALRDRLAHCFQSPGENRRLAESAKAKAEAEFSMERMVSAYGEEYRALVN